MGTIRGWGESLLGGKGWCRGEGGSRKILVVEGSEAVGRRPNPGCAG